jgi:hypothetical protein
MSFDQGTLMKNPTAWPCTFTSGEKWDPEYKDKLTHGKLDYLSPNWENGLTLPGPSNVDTDQDCRDLVQIVKARSKDLEKVIVWQAYSDARAVWKVQEVHGEPEFANRQLVAALLNEVQLPIFKLKNDHDRGRPWYCCAQTLKPMFQKPSPYYPGHPAYPSGHATMAYALAYVLSAIDPSKSQDFVDAAKSIAFNREVAGLHYPSDSEAGRILAEHLVKQLLVEPRFKVLVKATCAEWDTNSAYCLAP